MNLLALDKKICHHAKYGKKSESIFRKRHAFPTVDVSLEYRNECYLGYVKNNNKPCGRCHGKRIKGRVSPMFGDVK